jgi:hypothetical protein
LDERRKNMNISKRKQGILAIICTIAMIVTSITVYNPREVKAADWSTVDKWEKVSAGGIDYKVQKDGSFINDGFHAEGGGSWVNATNVLYMNFRDAAYTKAVINDVEYLSADHNKGTDECIRFEGAQVWISFDLFKFKKNTIVFYNGDTVLSSLYVYNPEGSDSDAPAPTAPVLNVTDFNATTNSFTFTWDDAENASYYDLYVGTTKVAGRVISGVSKTYRELGLEQTSEDQTIEFILKAVNGTGETASAVVEKTLPKFSWKSIDGTDKYAYNSNTKVNVVNIQGKDGKDSVYMNVPAGITSISVNGKTEAVGAIEGAGFYVYFSALTEEENEVVVYMGTESRTVIIKKLKDDSSDSSYTDGEVLVNESNQTKEVPAYTDGDYWRNEYNNMPVKYVNGKKYVAEVVVSSTAAKKIKMVFQRVNIWDFVDANQGYETSIAAGNKVKITYVFEATQSTDNGNFDIYLGSAADATTMVFESKKLTTYNEVPAGVQTGVEVLEAPGSTEYTVSIDGKEKQCKEGEVISVPTEGQGYYDVTEKVAYAPGTELTVNENMTLKSIKLNVTMTPGASIRLAAPTGLRFQTTVTSGNGIAADEILNSKTVTTGTLITTLDLYKANENTLTKDSKYTFLDIANDGWFNDGTKTETGKFCGSIIKIQSGNYGRAYIAVGYATIKYSDGSSKPVYANVTENNAKSIAYVAGKVKESAAYNKYDDAQKAIINKYIDGKEISE